MATRRSSRTQAPRADPISKQAPGPAARCPGELAESGSRQERPVAGVVAARGIPAAQVGVVEQPVNLRELEPVGRLAEQPGANPAPSVAVSHVQVPDIGPAAIAGQPLALLPRLNFDIADDLIVEDG